MLLKVCSEAVLQHEMHTLRCRGVLTIFLLFFSPLVSMKIPSAISHTQAALCVPYCRFVSIFPHFPSASLRVALGY